MTILSAYLFWQLLVGYVFLDDQPTEWPRICTNDTRKRSISLERLFHCPWTFLMSLMVSVGVSKFGCTDLFFVKPGIKVDGRYYHQEVLPKWEPVNSSHGELVTCDEFT